MPLNTHVLKQDLEELGMSLTQVIASLQGQTSLEAQENYRKVLKAEELFVHIAKQIRSLCASFVHHPSHSFICNWIVFC
jgi:hypothetical protein